MSELTKQLRIKAGMINLGERIEWGSETALMETAADLIDHLEAELVKLRAGQEPVAYITGQFAGRCVIEAINRAAVLPTGMALYTAPQPSAVADGFVLVPVEPTPEMVSAAEEAHMPFGDMDIALRMAMLAAPAPVQAEPASPWVAVSERLPEISGLVLVYRPTAHELPANDANVKIKPYSTTLGFGGCHKVTHWMTLPAAPSAEGEV